MKPKSGGRARDELVKLVASWTGIDLERGECMSTVEQFIAKRARSLRLSKEEYIASLDGPDHPEVRSLLEAITVGYTWFYRDPEQLELLSKLAKAECSQGRSVHVWVPGCATGEDVWTIAMLAERDGWTASLLGTDINSEFIERAQSRDYSEWALRHLPRELRRHFNKAPNGTWKLSSSLRSTIRFQRHNIMDSPLSPRWGKAGISFYVETFSSIFMPMMPTERSTD